MTASEAIERLQQLIALHGDLELNTCNSDTGFNYYNDVLSIEYAEADNGGNRPWGFLIH